MEHLERDLAVMPKVIRQIDCSHATASELALKRVAIGQGGRDSFDGVGQRETPICLSTAWKRGC